jgi:hypothetical protein
MAILDKIGRRSSGFPSGSCGSNRGGRDRISLRPNLQGLKIRSDGPEFREMSVKLGEAI